MKKYKEIEIRSSHRMDAPDRHNRQRDKWSNQRTGGRTDGRRDASLRPSVRLL